MSMIDFRDNRRYSGLDAIKNIERLWDMKITLPDKYHEWADKLAEFERIDREATDESLTAVLMRSPAEDWESIIAERSGREQINTFVRDNATAMKAALKHKADQVIYSPGMYDSIFEQLPVDEVEAEFVDAVMRLGDDYADPQKALDRDAEAAGAFRATGRKLIALPDVAHPLTNNIGAVRRYIAFGVFTDVEPLPPLEYSRDRQDSPIKYYGDKELRAHREVYSARTDAGNGGSYLIDLAAGKLAGMSLKIARDYSEVNRRIAIAESALESVRVAPRGSAGPRVAYL